MDEEEFYTWLESLAPEEQEQALYDFGFMNANTVPGTYEGEGGPSMDYAGYDLGSYMQLPPR